MVMKNLRDFLVPEFRNRLDGVVTFGKLEKPNVLKIVGKFCLNLKTCLMIKMLFVKLVTMH